MSVTSLIVTYNHAAYIETAIESALAQQTECRHEILISEDCSTDGTREIVRTYAERHPERIRLLLSDTNLHSNEVVARGFRAATGDFVALLDGDDYWLGQDKLQRQVDFLTAHPACALCFHNARTETGDPEKTWNWTDDRQPEITTLEDILRGNYIATCSAMFRRGLVTIPAWYADFFPITDWPLYILHAEKGDIGYIDEVMGVYRLHPEGLFSPASQDEKHAAIHRFYLKMNDCLERRLEPQLHAGMFRYFIEWAEAYRARGDVVRASRCLSQARDARPWARPRDAVRFAANRLHLLGKTKTDARAST